MSALLFATSLLVPQEAKPAAGAPQPIALVADATVHAPFQRASSPLRKHKRKNAPQRSALDIVEQEPAAPAASFDEAELEMSRKERRGSASPDPFAAAALAAALPGGRPQRPQRAVAVQPPPLPIAAPAPEQLAAVFEQPLAAPPPFLDAAAAPGAPKVCVQCGTTVTPMWRTVSGLTYCNADGLRLKRKLGLL